MWDEDIGCLVYITVPIFGHMSMSYPPTRGHPLNPNKAIDAGVCVIAPLNGNSSICSKKKFPCGGYPQDLEIVTTLTAGDIINVEFWNPNVDPKNSSATKQDNQARHNGGRCEFALSYDGGQVYTVIAAYHRTCPDVWYTWPVKIPENAPSCNLPGQCIFSWVWVNNLGLREFYQNCADVKIIGKTSITLPERDIMKVNFEPTFGLNFTPEGDPSNNGNAIGSGPLPEDVNANLAGAIQDVMYIKKKN
ncbi:hypothetical protein G9A89_001856 [Geosiphon pyriformis]|nr:hypothetical protein G9A89_001856 [Geosiphon pyriformis]